MGEAVSEDAAWVDGWLVETVETYLSIRGIITVSLVSYNSHVEKAYRVALVERLELPIHSKLMGLDSRMRGSMGRDSWATRLRLPVRRFELVLRDHDETN